VGFCCSIVLHSVLIQRQSSTCCFGVVTCYKGSVRLVTDALFPPCNFACSRCYKRALCCSWVTGFARMDVECWRSLWRELAGRHMRRHKHKLNVRRFFYTVLLSGKAFCIFCLYQLIVRRVFNAANLGGQLGGLGKFTTIAEM
jgi:hypothetical protein